MRHLATKTIATHTPAADVTQPSYSLYDLLDRWGFHDRAAMLLAMDQPNHPMPENRNATNTGFMVFRSGAKALQIVRVAGFNARHAFESYRFPQLDDIIACPETVSPRAGVVIARF